MRLFFGKNYRITGSFSKKNFCFVGRDFLWRYITVSCKKIASDFSRNLGAAFDRFFKTALYVYRRTIWQKLIFPRILFPKFFQILRRSLDFWRNVLRLVAATFPLKVTKLPSRCPEENCGFSKLFSKHERASAERWRKWQTMCRKTHLLLGWLPFNHSKWQKLRNYLPSNSNFRKDASQKKEGNIILVTPLLLQFVFIFSKN